MTTNEVLAEGNMTIVMVNDDKVHTRDACVGGHRLRSTSTCVIAITANVLRR